MEYRKLGDICDVVSGGTPSRSKPEYWDGDIPWIKIGNIKGKYVSEADEFITEEGLAGSSAKMLSKGTILYTIFATLGEAGVLTIDACTNQAIAGITIKNDDIIDRDYLYYYLKSKKNYVNDIGRGVAQNNINMSILRGFEVPIREMFEQQTITDILDKIGKIIDLRKEELNRFDELIKARFVELFGEDLAHTDITIGDIAEEATVGIANSATQAYSDSGIVMLRNQNIRINYLDDSDLIYITPDFAAKYENKKLKENDILITRTGVNIGMACLVPKEYEGCQTFTTLILRIKDNIEVSPTFVCYFINSPLGKGFINDRKVGGAQPNFGAKQLVTMPIVIPSKEKQEDFAELVKQVNKSKVAVQKSLDETQKLFYSLMQEYFG